MTTETEGNGVANPETASGNVGDENNENTGNRQSVSYESHRKLLGEKKKREAELRDANAKLAEYEAAKEAERQDKLKAEGKFNELSTQLKADLAAKEDELNSYKSTFTNYSKFGAIKKTLGANIEQKWFEVLDAKGYFDGIEIGDDKRPEEMSVTAICDRIKREFPEIIVTGTSSRLPNESPTGGKTLPYEDWLKLPVEEMKARQKEVLS